MLLFIKKIFHQEEVYLRHDPFNYIGGMEMIDGTGKFEDCSGVTAMKGKYDEANKTNSWSVEGTMEYN